MSICSFSVVCSSLGLILYLFVLSPYNTKGVAYMEPLMVLAILLPDLQDRPVWKPVELFCL